MDEIITAIILDDLEQLSARLVADPGIVNRLADQEQLLQSGIFHWIYVGDTALHVASAGYRVRLVQLLLTSGANPNAAANRRRGTPLHYAADGFITGPAWDPHKQVSTLESLLAAGAKLDSQDGNGATALHRATRTRCAAAVTCLLAAGADPTLPNKSGSTPFHLAVQATGRGGSGEQVARDAQRDIVKAFLTHGVSPSFTDGKGHTVLQCARGEWIHAVFRESAA
jgi:ankyrin repeat protein